MITIRRCYLWSMKTEDLKENSGAADIFIKALRTATAPMHKALEENEVSRKLLSQEVTYKDYAAYLEAMKGVIEAFDERLVPAVLGVVPDAEQRKKQKEVLSDLNALAGMGATVKSGGPFKGIQQDKSMAYFLGYFYVIEGSTLGGRVILKHLQSRLDLGEDTTRFFAGYGEETGSKWKAFMHYFTEYVLTHNTQEEAINGAIAGFTEIGEHLRNQG